jgi:superfamily II DNA or RNA helicase
MQFILNDMKMKPKQPKVIYSAFVKNTLSFVEKCLLLSGYTRYRANDMDNSEKSNIKTRKFAVISGDIDPEERDEIMRISSSKENMYGDLIDTVLLSSAGSEGLDFKNVRNIYIFEPHWNYARIKQIIARVVRYESHINLPLNERNVNAYLLLSITSSNVAATKSDEKKQEINQEELSTDETLWDRSIKNKFLIDQFINAIIETSIDCSISNKNNKLTCFMCNPDGKKLFDLNFDKDINIESPCKLTNVDNIYNKDAKKVKVTEIKVDGIKYFVSNENEKNPNIYKFDDKLNGYVEVDPATYSKIINFI